MTEGTTTRLQEVFRAALGFEPNVNVTALTQDNEPKWDSVAHVLIVAGIESEFGVSIDPADSLSIKSFEGARQALAELGVA
ncbi:MAG TPA: acyl carrier protein [Gemmatimonadaceae bacterium]